MYEILEKIGSQWKRYNSTYLTQERAEIDARKLLKSTGNTTMVQIMQ